MQDQYTSARGNKLNKDLKAAKYNSKPITAA
jgi:hypothetical protein